ncbi:hypothetical protein Ae201684P_007381 [Aphanomyces euteiches]|uniref:Uncharacterized protein n=1 Tax=Aphanomyces euteiches TaxID=100861 RepID=A0A6G0X8Q6_9STRA|nr:hypothetical protein Ae201684_007408 [Aphanomyces euteiches]KAH9101197.1 hypothetical protein Ae201684P_007381 [Aphanomyces euteiches]
MSDRSRQDDKNPRAFISHLDLACYADGRPTVGQRSRAQSPPCHVVLVSSSVFPCGIAASFFPLEQGCNAWAMLAIPIAGNAHGRPPVGRHCTVECSPCHVYFLHLHVNNVNGITGGFFQQQEGTNGKHAMIEMC